MLVIIAITGISGWLQKKAQADQEKSAGGNRRASNANQPQPSAQPARRPGQQPAQKTMESESPADLETQLRRWFQKEFTDESGPPVILPETAQAHPVVPTTEVYPKAPRVRESVPEHALKLESHLRESTSVAESANDIRETAVRHRDTARPVPDQRLMKQLSQGQRRSDEVASAISMMRSPGTVRQAMIASFILAPPKGLEDL